MRVLLTPTHIINQIPRFQRVTHDLPSVRTLLCSKLIRSPDLLLLLLQPLFLY